MERGAGTEKCNDSITLKRKHISRNKTFFFKANSRMKLPGQFQLELFLACDAGMQNLQQYSLPVKFWLVNKGIVNNL